jgi:hypothetical protein
MRIEAGKYYWRRDGEVVGPVDISNPEDGYFFVTAQFTWNDKGECVSDLRSEYDLVKEAFVSDVPTTERENALKNENAQLKAALQSVMIGGNHLASIIGPDAHLPHTALYADALEHYGAGAKYDAWCCWKSIMDARDAVGEKL